MEIIITSLLTFVSTNIDDIFILTLFYGDRKFSSQEIIIGQFVGILSLVAISLLLSLVGFFINAEIVGLLGIFPIYLGIKGIVKFFQTKEEDNKLNLKSGRNNIIAIAGITIANGGDNIGIYVPLFTTLTWINKSVMIVIFLIMTFIWCIIAKYLIKHPYIAGVIEKYGSVLTPFVLILLGCYILYESGTIHMIFN